MILYYDEIDTPIGKIGLVANSCALLEIIFSPEKLPQMELGIDNQILNQAKIELAEYFGGRRKEFSIPFELKGTEFQKRVWKELSTIPFGKTISYGELAKRVGNPKASRAVGAANGRNPLAIILPCHRVIGADGSLTGFAGGVDVKKNLLLLEHCDG